MPAAGHEEEQPPSAPPPFEHHSRLTRGQAIWWIPAPEQLPSTIEMDTDTDATANTDVNGDTRKFSFELKDLMQNLSFHCYGKLVEQGRRLPERFFWLIFHITALSVLIAFLWNTYNRADQTLVTTIHGSFYPIWKVKFPAVTICDVVRISKSGAWRYATKLSQKDPFQRNASFFYNELHAFEMFYTQPMEKVERAKGFQRFLDSIDVAPDEIFYNLRQRLYDMSPNCSNMLVSCRMGGQHFNCMDHFHESLSSQGFCCTFNQNGTYKHKSINYQQYFGPAMGLSLTLKTIPSDYFYNFNTLTGFVVYVYEPGNFPDSISGSVDQRFVRTGHLSFLPIGATIYETVNEARRLRPDKRNCRFSNESSTNIPYNYTLSKCITACRATSVMTHCKCAIFNVPSQFVGGPPVKPYCNLQHVQCLSKFSPKWLNVITRLDPSSGIWFDLENALFCPQCLPPCTETRYTIHGAMYLPLTALTSSRLNYGLDYGNGTELAAVRIYFVKTHIQNFRQIIKNAWYEVLSTIGNICSIIAGFSLIGICELVFFLAKQLWSKLKAEAMEKQRIVRATTTRAKAKARGRGGAKGRKQKKMELLILP